jgi:exonuclease SbcC
VWESALSKIERNLIEIIDIDSDITKSTIALAMIREDSQKLISEKNIIENQIETTEKTKREIRKLNNQIKTDSNEVEIYNELSSAFGRNGIQALLIERAVPQIQNTANQLLSRLTHNRMSIKLNFQKGRIDRLTGIHSEELDISISDEIGTRSYETFSGGETFRIDFAIRISLSKLLASRSGAPLPILFIDEGFGSQDAEGQERLIEAIQSIQDDFEKIIVITHIEQMKEHFDQIIQVVKTDAGSKIQIN